MNIGAGHVLRRDNSMVGPSKCIIELLGTPHI